MGPGFRSLPALTLRMILAACTTWREVPRWQPPATSGQSTLSPDLEPGDGITATTTDSQKSETVFVALTADFLEGTVGEDEHVVRLPRDQIALVERREFSALETTGLVVSVVAVAFVTLLAIGLSLYAPMP